MTKPFFSIVIPTLNEEKYLPRLLKDLTSQTFQNFEVIVADGHSEDKTVIKAKSLAKNLPSLKVVTSTKRHVCAQRNLGASKARANWLVFMDADNRLPRNFLKKISDYLSKNSVGILTTWLQPDEKTLPNLAISTAINLFFEAQISLKSSYLLESMIICSQKSFAKIGGFDESVDYAEGKTFIRTAGKLGIKATIIRDPIYSYSFRRVRKHGLVGMIGRVGAMELLQIVGLDKKLNKLPNLYPMRGGRYFESKSRHELTTLINNKFILPAKKKFVLEVQKRLK